MEEKSTIREYDNPKDSIPRLVRSLSFRVAKELAAKGRHSSYPSLDLGQAYLELNKLEEAELIFDKIRELDQENGTFGLGLVYEAQERLEKGSTMF